MSNQSQPAILPATLPAGTRTRYGNEATSELTLTDERRYHGNWSGFAHQISLGAYIIDWDLVAVQAAVPAEEDRPIQAGDWVECVRDWGSCGGLCLGERHKVNYAYKLDSGELGVQFENGFTWVASRFKRVSGPHPTSSVPVGTGNAQSSGTGDVDRKACSDGMCGACENCLRRARERWESKRDPYTEHRLSVDEHADTSLYTTGHASARLEAWSRAEKPRVTNRAQRKQMAAGHPASWPSNEGEE